MKSHFGKTVLTALVCLLNLAGCDSLIGPQGEAVTLAVEPARISLAPGESVRLRAVARDAAGKVVKGGSIRWSANGLARVSDRGVLRAGPTEGFAVVVASLGNLTTRAHAAIGPVTFRNIDSVVVATYRDVYGISLPAPAVVLPTQSIDTNRGTGPLYWVSSAYVGDRNFTFFVSPSGKITDFFPNTTKSWLQRPQGRIRVLVVAVDAGNTNIGEVLETSWRAAQDSVNKELRAYFRSQRFDTPLLVFETTNLLVPADSLPTTVFATTEEERLQLHSYLERHGYSETGYDVLVRWAVRAGGTGEAYAKLRYGWDYVKVGCQNCFVPNDGGRLQLSDDLLHDHARLMYFHEIGHVFGWGHDWGGGLEGTRLITMPELFGWTDTDGDGVPEIIDPTPYGIKAGR